MQVLPALTTEQVATILGVSTSTVRRMAIKKELPGFLVGKNFRFYAPDVAKRFGVNVELFNIYSKEII
jgi:excisionase family DNA binding protein